MLATWHFHIEISSKCTLKCTRCARQEVPDSLVNTELTLKFFKKNFTPEFILEHVEKITFCGDDGDPIYAHDLIPVIQYVKSVKPVEFLIVTNGSYKKTQWWIDLGRTLTSLDTVHFSIDGYDQHSNDIYRVNSNFNSIITGIKSLRSSSTCKLVWAAIAFKFNEDHLDSMKSHAVKLGMDVFQLTLSTKFGKIYPHYGEQDPLEPSSKYVSHSYRFERVITPLTALGKMDSIHPINIQLIKNADLSQPIVPLCSIGNKGLYIDAQGRLYPCCWVANRYGHNSEWRELAKRFDLNHRDLTDVVNDQFWDTELRTFRWTECQTKCKSSVMTENYMSSW
jgi:MoaA/NifB/PqqE/SkfB family radical SAM enzyme